MYLPYLPIESKIGLIDRSLIKREEMLKLLKFHLRRAKEKMKETKISTKGTNNIK